MFFAWDILVDAGKKEDDPKKQILKLTKGVITRVDIKFPPGCNGMVKVRLFRYESQLIPLSRDEWVTGDSESVPTEAFYELTEVPTQLKFIGCSPGTTNPHTVTLRVQVLPMAVATFAPLVKLMTKFLKLVGVL